MKQIRLIHTADIHLRDQQYGRFDRGQDFTDALFRVIDVAMSVKAHGIIMSGDILDSKKPSSKNIKDIIELNSRLQAAKIPMYAITGNHDKSTPSWLSVLNQKIKIGTQWIIDMDWAQEIIKAGGMELKIHGIPDCAPDKFREYTENIRPGDILMFHAPIREFASFKMNADALELKDIPTDKFRAVLLGDIHTHDYRAVGNCIVGYPGSTELCRATEAPEKFVSLFVFSDDGSIVRTPIPLLSSRTIIMRDVNNEQDVLDTIEDIKRKAGNNALILIRKHPDMFDVYSRLAAIVDVRNAILRVRNIPGAISNLLNAKKNIELEISEHKEPKDFLSDFISRKDNNELFELAEQLCDKNIKPAVLIEKYIDHNLREDHTFST